MEDIIKLCKKSNLGNIVGTPEMVTGGLMHKMYHVHEVMITESQSKEEIVQEIYNDIQNK